MEEIEPSPVGLLTIEWNMLNKQKFLGFSLMQTISLRMILYPLTVIKTRLQLQRSDREVAYRGTADAFRKIVQTEGFRGLYKGFWINTVQVVSGFGYILTYEKARHILSMNNIQDNRLKGLIAGGVGSLVSQTIICPFDVISQHLMLMGRTSRVKNSSDSMHINLSSEQVRRFGVARSVVKELYRVDGGFRAYYRGYLSSVITFVPTSALWWMFYPVYSDRIARSLPSSTSHILIHCSAGSLSGMTVAVLTNSLDVLRANIQVRRLPSIVKAAKLLWSEERFNILVKGLSARIVHGGLSSTFIAAGYETMKRLSLHDQYKDHFRW